jgi:hypothetical protein
LAKSNDIARTRKITDVVDSFRQVSLKPNDAELYLFGTLMVVTAGPGNQNHFPLIDHNEMLTYCKFQSISYTIVLYEAY